MTDEEFIHTLKMLYPAGRISENGRSFHFKKPLWGVIHIDDTRKERYLMATAINKIAALASMYGGKGKGTCDLNTSANPDVIIEAFRKLVMVMGDSHLGMTEVPV